MMWFYFEDSHDYYLIIHFVCSCPDRSTVLPETNFKFSSKMPIWSVPFLSIS